MSLLKFINYIAIISISSTVMATDNPVVNKGEQLYQEHCVSCHDAKVYTNPERIVDNLEELTNHVKSCKIPQQSNWTEEDIFQVVNYLNNNFYHFASPPSHNQ